MLSYLPLAHALERAIVEVPSFIFGPHLYFTDSLKTFVTDLKRARPTVFASVPRLWQKFQSGVFEKMPPSRLKLLQSIPVVSGMVNRKILTGLGLEHVRLAGGGSAPLPAELLRWYERLGLPILEAYGMSENFTCSHMNRPGRARIGYVGHPLPGVEHRIAESGEVEVLSPGNMTGYHKEPEKTAETFTEDGWVKTGDRGEIDEEGRLRITGRVKEIFKTSKGKYVSPSQIEDALLAHPDIEMACVTGVGQPQPHALVMLTEKAQRSLPGSREDLESRLAAHREQVNGTLAHHEVLQFLAVVAEPWTVENGFLTPTLKLKRARVEEVFGASTEDWYARNAPVIWIDCLEE